MKPEQEFENELDNATEHGNETDHENDSNMNTEHETDRDKPPFSRRRSHRHAPLVTRALLRAHEH